MTENKLDRRLFAWLLSSISLSRPWLLSPKTGLRLSDENVEHQYVLMLSLTLTRSF